MAETYSAGIVTAYGAAVRGGYTGTYEQFCAEQAQFGANAAKVAQDRAAVEAATQTFTTVTVPGAVQAVQQTGATQVQAVEAASETEQQQIALAGAAQETRVTQAGDDQVDAVEEAGATQVGNVNTAGTTQVGNVNTAGTTQVGAVNTAGATQVQAVEDKGQEVIDSIPDDYTKLTEDVADLKSAFNSLVTDDAFIDVVDAEWVQNRALISNDHVLVEVSSTTFAHSNFIPTTKNATISVASGFKIFAWRCEYNEFGHAAPQVTSAWSEGNVAYTYLPNYPYLIICVMKSNSSTITAEEAAAAVSIYSEETSPFALKAEVNDCRYMTSAVPAVGQILYSGDTAASDGFLVNALAYDDGVIVGCRSNGNVVRIGYDGAEASLLSLTGSKMDWRLCWKDSKDNVYVSPHASLGSMRMADRGLYRLAGSTLDWINLDHPAWETGAIAGASIGLEITFNAGASAFRHVYAPVTPGEQVRIRTYTTASKTNRYGVFTDDNNIVISRPEEYYPQDETAGFRYLPSVVVPNGATRLHIMTYTQSGWETECAVQSYQAIPAPASSFVKVISLYDPNSGVQTETEENNDCIWTMCEDANGNLYAGVYAHTIHANPAIYKSTDGGNTWSYLVNFNTAGLTTNGRHIHSIAYSKWQKALYCIVGEVNTIFKSTDEGATWTDLHVTLTDKGTVILPTEYGLLIGSDNAYNVQIDLLLNDDKTHKTVFFGWANTVFAMRRSDITGIVYAFTKVDSSVNAESAYPPYSAITSQADLDTWKATSGHDVYKWQKYHDSVVDEYPEDAIRPQHFGILVSRDGGLHWDVLKRFPIQQNESTGNTYIDGFWTTGQFLNGECLTGRMKENNFTNPVVISEGKHKYVSGGCDLDGEIFARTNASSTVTVL